MSDAIQHCKLMHETSLETTHEITKLVTFSPRRDGLLDQLEGDGPGVQVLCPTHWTVCAASMHSVIHSILQEL